MCVEQNIIAEEICDIKDRILSWNGPMICGKRKSMNKEKKYNISVDILKCYAALHVFVCPRFSKDRR